MSDEVTKVEERDPSLRNSEITTEGDMEMGDSNCYWNGTAYSPGAKICAYSAGGNRAFLCRYDPNGSQWLDLGSC